MDEKPRFWDFCWAAKRKGHLRIYDKELGALKVYKIPKSLGYWIRFFRFRDTIASLLPLLAIYKILPYNFIFDAYIIICLLQVFIYWIYYLYFDYEEVPTSEWLEEDIKASEKKPLKAGTALKTITIAILLTFVFLNSYSFTYLRYMAEGGRDNEKATVNISLPDHTNKELIDSPQELVYSKSKADGNNDLRIEVNTLWIPGKVFVYLNGNEIEPGYIYERSWLFWESVLFKSRCEFFISNYELSSSNTLEVKSDNFDKTWTFTLEQG